jgi:hypothetical protein
MDEIIGLLLKKLLLFAFLGSLFWSQTPNVGYMFWAILLLAAAGWLFLGYKRDPALIKSALLWGLFLALLDLLVQNTGAALGLWFVSGGAFSLGVVPVEVSILAIIGGAAWMLYQPKKPDKIYLLADSAVFGLGGMLGEIILIQNGMMHYAGFWNSAWAFIAYFLVWIAGNWVWYRFFR